eukprot:TRINITY_DN197_c0_g1_i1.p1 TRINITY_DN197_c0_g1~~TRINITY_DN197_c0_g1_i1.p1  ORF type:complete len:181 (+),score=74.13 TRINITY_DN197_c0_g1_i1:372-914(+)
MGQKLTARVLFIGLDGAGKTSLVNCLEKGPSEFVAQPTVGFLSAEIQRGNVIFAITDTAGGATVRDLWRHYFEQTDAIVWVVDASNPERFNESKNALNAALRDAAMPRECPFLIAANKSDQPGCQNAEAIKTALNLASALNGRSYQVFATSSRNGEGVDPGFTWLRQEIKILFKKRKNSS